LAKKEKAADTSSAEDTALVTAAKAIGATAGKLAVLTGVAADKPNTPKSEKKGKLLPKSKARLPRRQKKAQRKKVGVKPS